MREFKESHGFSRGRMSKNRSAQDRRKIRGEKKMKKEEFLKVISEKDNDQNVNELIGEIEEHVFDTSNTEPDRMYLILLKPVMTMSKA